MAGDGRSDGMGAGLTWAETTQPEVAQSEFGSPSNATTSRGCLKSEFEGCHGTAVPSQPGNCTRDRSQVQKLEQALLLMSDCPGVVTDVLKQELEKARTASKRPPIDVEVEQCRKFITRSEKRVAELDAERAAEFSALTEAKGRLQHMEAEQAAATSLPAPSAPLFSSPECAEIVALNAKVAEVEGERDAAIRSRTSGQRPRRLWQVQVQISRCP